MLQSRNFVGKLLSDKALAELKSTISGAMSYLQTHYLEREAKKLSFRVFADDAC